MYEHRSIASLHRAFSEGLLDCERVVSDLLLRIDEKRHLNAFVEVYAEEALERARALDRKKAEGAPTGRLFGVVIGVKDVICQKGKHVSAGSAMLRGFTSLFDATAIERLLQEDAVIIGSLNCDEFAMGSSNEHSAYGPVLNPIDETRVPGGSSGGSAAAVAAGLCMASLGSDTGGSVRQPADFCGVIGLKPGYGRISRHGLIAYASSFDQIGILGTDIGDIALLLEIMAGPDRYDSTAIQEAPPPYSALLESNQRPFRIACIRQAVEHPSLDAEIAAGIRNFLARLEKDGHRVEMVDVDFLDRIVPTYYVLTTAEASSNLSRYDGVRYGHRSTEPADSLEEFYRKNRSEGFGDEVKRRIMLGTFVLSTGYYEAYFNRAQQARNRIREKTSLILKDFDIILLPTSPTTAFHLGEKGKDPVAMFLADIFTVFANLTGISGISFPIGKHTNGMPFGIQAMAGQKDELNLLRFSRLQFP